MRHEREHIGGQATIHEVAHAMLLEHPERIEWLTLLEQSGQSFSEFYRANDLPESTVRWAAWHVLD